MKGLATTALLLSAVVANAAPIDPSLFHVAHGIEIDGNAYTLDGNQSAVESLYLDNFWVGAGTQSLTFDMLFHWNDGQYDAARNVLAFRLFPDGGWEDQWTAYSPNDLWRAFEPDFGDITASVTIDLSPYQNTAVAMGWSFIADDSELSFARVSNINLVPEPSTLALMLLAGLGFIVVIRAHVINSKAVS